MKIKVLKKDDEKKKMTEIGLLSWMGNQVVKGFNPADNKPNDKPLVAEIFVEHDKNKSGFNYIVKSFISGIKGSIVPGIGKTFIKYEKQKAKEQQKEQKQQKREKHKQEKSGK